MAKPPKSPGFEGAGKPARRGLNSSIAGISLALVAFVLLAGTSGCTLWRMRQAVVLAAQSEPYQQLAEQSPSFGAGGGRLLIVGDSTAVGTGASSPASSVGGLIGRDHPRLTVVNRARDGARFADIPGQLRDAGDFNVILILAGGNDVIRLTGHERLVHGVQQTLALARRQAPVVVIMPSGNVGNAPFFFPPWSWLMTQRSRELHAIAQAAARQSGAVYVSVFAERAVDPFAQEPKRFNAVDGLHPSDAGYQLWYRELKRQAKLDASLS